MFKRMNQVVFVEEVSYDQSYQADRINHERCERRTSDHGHIEVGDDLSISNSQLEFQLIIPLFFFFRSIFDCWFDIFLQDLPAQLFDLLP